MTLIDAIEIVTALACREAGRLEADGKISNAESEKNREAINTLEDFAVNYLGDD